MTTDGITAFISARLAEDEAAAKAAWGVEWSWRDLAGPFRERPNIAHTGHIARHDPARVLRQVAAIRRILERHQARPDGMCSAHPYIRADACPEKLDVASIWADHPEYQEGWRCG